MDEADILDCLVIGGGPAGLTGAIYLGRFRRRFEVIDAGHSRARLIPKSHNHAGFPDGVRGPDLLHRMRVQARRYGPDITAAEVSRLEATDFGFVASVGERQVGARTVLIATGVVDAEPELPDLPGAIRRGLIRHCGICDGYEVIGHRIGVLGRGSSGLHEALFLRDYTADIKLLSHGQPLDLCERERELARNAGIELVPDPVTSVTVSGDRIESVETGGRRLFFDSLYSALGSTARTSLLTTLGTRVDGHGCVITDEHQRSSTENLFAAGDVVLSLDQISVAMGEAAIAATAIHNCLRGAMSFSTGKPSALSLSPGYASH